MVEKDLEYARKSILSGKIPIKIKRYHRSRLFWHILMMFAAIILCFNLSGKLPWVFWLGIIPLVPVVLVLAWWRRRFSKAPEHDFGLILVTLALLAIGTLRGLAIIGFPAADCFPANLHSLARIVI